MNSLEFDIIVVGAGHAGCEAALAGARMGCRTALLTIHLDAIAQMSCNPAIGGIAKGQIVREIDALGGEMAKVIDVNGIQFRMLNTGKGPAMYSPRAQADKHLYSLEMKRRLEQQPGLAIRQEMVDELLVEGNRVAGVRTTSGLDYRARAVILTTGTFLKGLIHVGPNQTRGGRLGELSAEHLSDSHRRLGFEMGRLKTGTPPRVNCRTVDFARTSRQDGDPEPRPFSFSTDRIEREQVPCWLTETNPRTHEIIRANLDRAPLYTGQIRSVGPRYCPSIEDKIVRFADRDHHQVFLEPEGASTLEMYCNGIPTSLPQDVQEDLVHSIRGLEEAQIMRYGYAIEYDFVPPTQLKPSLETKRVAGLFHAGQINGTSGYEEAAGQGLVAGINAARALRDEAPLVLGRDEAYIGVMIDDLVTRGTNEPYRMFTSRAEYRLLLRQDNADRRLMRYGRESGLIDDAAWQRLRDKEAAIAAARTYLQTHRDGARTLEQLLRRPDRTLADLAPLDPALAALVADPAVAEQVEIEVKYEGFIQRQRTQVEQFRKLENQRIPDWVDYDKIPELKREAKQKLTALRPASIGQAARISGISPADVSIVVVYLRGGRR